MWGRYHPCASHGSLDSCTIFSQLFSRASLFHTAAVHLTLELLEETVEPQPCLDSSLSPLNLVKSPGD